MTQGDTRQSNYPFHCSLDMRTNIACLDDTLHPTNIIIEVGVNMTKRAVIIILTALVIAFVGGKAYTIWHDNDLVMTASTHEHIVDLPIQNDSAFGYQIEKLLYDEDANRSRSS